MYVIEREYSMYKQRRSQLNYTALDRIPDQILRTKEHRLKLEFYFADDIILSSSKERQNFSRGWQMTSKIW